MVKQKEKRVAQSLKKISLFDIIIYALCTIAGILVIYPFLNVLAVSVSEKSDYLSNPLMIWPRHFNFEAYGYVLQQKLVLTGYANTIITAVAGTFLSVFLTVTMAYPLSRKDLRGLRFFSLMLIFTMMFSGGLIPTFLLIKGIGMYNTIWALIIPGSLSAYNCILVRKFFLSIPESLQESAFIDGANDLDIFTKIILPLSTPILATITLFYAVGRWNSFFQAVVYARSRSLWTLQLVLREMVMTASVLEGDVSQSHVSPQNVKYAVIVVSALPILCFYPFVQKYFVKGIMLGAVKG